MGKNWRRGSSEKLLLQKGNTIQAAMWRDYGQLVDWASVGGKYKISKAMAFRVAHGYEPKRKAIRAALGFPEIKQITAPVCECGEVHVSKRCPNKPRPPAKPRTRWKQVAQELADALEPARLFVAYANFEAGYPGGSYRKKDVLPKIDAALARVGRNCPPLD